VDQSHVDDDAFCECCSHGDVQRKKFDRGKEYRMMGPDLSPDYCRLIKFQ
jgi:hypothetical protein